MGYIWLAANVLGTGGYQVYVKFAMPAVKKVGDKEGLTNFGMTYYNNVLSLPILVLGALYFGEHLPLNNDGVTKPDALSALLAASPATQAIVGLSTLLGFCLSLSASTLNKRITAT